MAKCHHAHLPCKESYFRAASKKVEGVASSRLGRVGSFRRGGNETRDVGRTDRKCHGEGHRSCKAAKGSASSINCMVCMGAKDDRTAAGSTKNCDALTGLHKAKTLDGTRKARAVLAEMVPVRPRGEGGIGMHGVPETPRR